MHTDVVWIIFLNLAEEMADLFIPVSSILSFFALISELGIVIKPI